MTATSKSVKTRRVIKVPRGTISRISYSPPKLPAKPGVKARSYGRTKSGRYIIPRFIVTSTRGYRTIGNRWWVLDMETGNVAKKTNRGGYPDKKEARRIAQEFAEIYGAWASMPF